MKRGDENLPLIGGANELSKPQVSIMSTGNLSNLDRIKLNPHYDNSNLSSAPDSFGRTLPMYRRRRSNGHGRRKRQNGRTTPSLERKEDPEGGNSRVEQPCPELEDVVGPCRRNEWQPSAACTEETDRMRDLIGRRERGREGGGGPEAGTGAGVINPPPPPGHGACIFGFFPLAALCWDFSGDVQRTCERARV